MGTWLFQAVNCSVIQVGYSQNNSLQSHTAAKKARMPLVDISVDPTNWPLISKVTITNKQSFTFFLILLSAQDQEFSFYSLKNLKDLINYQVFELKKFLEEPEEITGRDL